MKINLAKRTVLGLLLFSHIAYSAFSQQVPPDGDQKNRESALQLLDEVMQRYWSNMGTYQGSLSILNRAVKVIDYIADPVTRHALMAHAELYRGYIEREYGRRSRARSYLDTAAEIAERSLEYGESSAAFYIRAAAAYARLETKLFRRKSKHFPQLLRWCRKALLLNPSNDEAKLLEIQILMQWEKDEVQLNRLKDELIVMESQADADKMTVFRARILLSELEHDLSGQDEGWLRRAKEIFPNSSLVR